MKYVFLAAEVLVAASLSAFAADDPPKSAARSNAELHDAQQKCRAHHEAIVAANQGAPRRPNGADYLPGGKYHIDIDCGAIDDEITKREK